MKEFDENEVISLIRKALPTDYAMVYSDDDILNVVDMIWDYYEINGLLDPDVNDDDNEETDILPELIDYAKRMLNKDKACKIKPEHLEAIISAELDYEDMLDQAID